MNVIAFPKPVTPKVRSRNSNGAKTLFVHIRHTTLIAHLASPKHPIVPGGNRVSHRS